MTLMARPGERFRTAAGSFRPTKTFFIDLNAVDDDDCVATAVARSVSSDSTPPEIGDVVYVQDEEGVGEAVIERIVGKIIHLKIDFSTWHREDVPTRLISPSELTLVSPKP